MGRSVQPVSPREGILTEALHLVGRTPIFETLLVEMCRLLLRTVRLPYAAIFVACSDDCRFARRAQAGKLPGREVAAALDPPLDPDLDPIVGRLVASRQWILQTATDQKGFLRTGGFEPHRIGVALALPLSVNGTVSGFGLLLGGLEDTPPSREDIDLAETIVRAASASVRLDRVAEDTVRIDAQRRTIRALTAAVLEENNLRKALELACRETQALTGATGAAILLVGPSKQLSVAVSLGEVAHWPDHQLLQHIPFRSGGVPVEPILLDHFTAPLDAPEVGLIRSILAVPLQVRGNPLGLLQLFNPESGPDLGHLRAILPLVERLSVMIEHTRLHEEQGKVIALEERHRLARDLHDSVTQLIYGVTVFAEASVRHLEAGRTGEAAGNLRELRDAALEALHEMRVLIFELHPPEVDKLDLEEALQSRLRAVERRAGLATEFSCEGLFAIPKEIGAGLYRIAQEALNNAVNHARASKISVRLWPTEESVRMVIADDGVGFDLAAARSSAGLGLKGMEERAQEIGAELRILADSRGTQISVTVPKDTGPRPTPTAGGPGSHASGGGWSSEAPDVPSDRGFA